MLPHTGHVTPPTPHHPHPDSCRSFILQFSSWTTDKRSHFYVTCVKSLSYCTFYMQFFIPPAGGALLEKTTLLDGLQFELFLHSSNQRQALKEKEQILSLSWIVMSLNVRHTHQNKNHLLTPRKRKPDHKRSVNHVSERNSTRRSNTQRN